MTFHDNEAAHAERDEQRWSDWKPLQPNIFPLPGREGEK